MGRTHPDGVHGVYVELLAFLPVYFVLLLRLREAKPREEEEAEEEVKEEEEEEMRRQRCTSDK